MMSAGQPQPGDVLIRRTHASDERYVLSRFPGGQQFSFRTYDEALNSARGFAARERVDVWYAADAVSLERVAAYRSIEPAG